MYVVQSRLTQIALKPACLAIGQVGPGVLQAQISDQRLGRIADDEERLAALVDEIPPIPGDLEGEQERALRCLRIRVPCCRAAGPLGVSTTNRSASSDRDQDDRLADRSPPEQHAHGSSPYTVSCVVPAT